MKIIAIAVSLTTSLVTSVAFSAELLILLAEKKMTSENAVSERNFEVELGELFAGRSHRTAKFVIRPRKRLATTLEANEADILCGYIPEWLPGDFAWSTGFVDVGDALITDKRVHVPTSLTDLRKVTIGTILGYTYPEVEKVLGKDFVRDDAPSASSNLRKLVAGRFDHAIVSLSSLHYHLKVNDPPLSIYPPLIVTQFKSQCAVGKNSPVTLEELNKIIESVQHDGSLSKLMQKYSR
jgi:polar amino acid transport system substrate-binding protein